eukprot:3276407-Pleurochrysis_carterae.AAC.1
MRRCSASSDVRSPALRLGLVRERPWTTKNHRFFPADFREMVRRACPAAPSAAHSLLPMRAHLPGSQCRCCPDCRPAADMSLHATHISTLHRCRSAPDAQRISSPLARSLRSAPYSPRIPLRLLVLLLCTESAAAPLIILCGTDPFQIPPLSPKCCAGRTRSRCPPCNATPFSNHSYTQRTVLPSALARRFSACSLRRAQGSSPLSQGTDASRLPSPCSQLSLVFVSPSSLPC